MWSNVPDCAGEQCAYSSKVENIFLDDDDISKYEDDIYSENCTYGRRRV